MRPSLPVLACAIALCGACDDTITVPNAAPEIEITAYCSQSERTWFIVALTDAEGDRVDVDLVANGQRLPAGPTGAGLTGLRTERDGSAEHLVEWGQACADCPDVCAAPPGPSELAACGALEGAAPAEISVVAHLDDGSSRVVTAPTSLTLGDCPE